MKRFSLAALFLLFAGAAVHAQDIKKCIPHCGGGKGGIIVTAPKAPDFWNHAPAFR